MRTLGQIAYEAYVQAFPGQARELAHAWEDLPDYVKACWDSVAIAVGQAQ